MYTVIFLCLISYVPHDQLYRDNVDLIEINHFYDEHGRLVFDQLIFYDWKERVEEPIKSENGEIIGISYVDRYQVRGWRLIKNLNQWPTKDWSSGMYKVLWMDGELMRYITSKAIRETWTQHDPELIERDFLPKEQRKELKSIPIKNNKPHGAIRPNVNQSMENL